MNNIFNGFQRQNIKIDFQKFRVWLSQKYSCNDIYSFMGYIEENRHIYEQLTEYGYIVQHKDTVKTGNKYKGNCDAEMILKIVSDYYEGRIDRCVLVTSDGDFACVVDFLNSKNVTTSIVTTNIYKCSILLRRKRVSIINLSQHQHKFL